MPNPIVDKHFERLKARHPDATLAYLKSGAALISVPRRPLPTGWSATEVMLRYIAPKGYSVAAPDCFWVEPSITVNGAVPKSSELKKAIPGTDMHGHWFSWHVLDGQWSANEHDLISWLATCMERLQAVQ
jgi:hypothetical protein